MSTQTAIRLGSTVDLNQDRSTLPKRVSLLKGAAQSLTLTWRNIVKIRRNPETLVDVTFMPIIFIVLFVFVFGGAIGGNWKDYLQFVLPGIMAQSLVFSSLGTGTALNQDIEKGIFDRFRSLPISRSAPLIAAIGGDVVRYVISVTIMVGFGSILGFHFTTSFVSGLAACLLGLGFALALSWVWVWVGTLVSKAQAVQGIGMLIMFPLSFGSSVFVEPSTLPGWMQSFVAVNPVTHLTDAIRGLMLGGPVGRPLLYTLLWMAGLVAVFAPLAIRAYRKRV